MMFESAKLLAASMSSVEWYKFHAHISFLSEVIQILMWANSHERGIGSIQLVSPPTYVCIIS